MERQAYIRAAKIDDLIRRRRYPNCRILAEEFKVSERTVLRDIEAMKDSLGAPIKYSKKRNGYYYKEEGFILPSLHMTEGELISVFLGTQVLKAYKNTQFEEKMRSAFEKIKLMLPDSVSIDFEEVGRAYSFNIEHTKDLEPRSVKIFNELSRAIKDKKSVEIQYYKIYGRTTEKRVFDPYHLTHRIGAWYIIGYCHLTKGIRTFAVDRIREIKVLENCFETVKGFSVDKFFADTWRLEHGGPITKVVVRFDPEIAPWIGERKWHPSQQTEENRDGSVTLTFRVAGTGEIKRWIMGFGSYAEVLEPKKLWEEILEEAELILKKKQRRHSLPARKRWLQLLRPQ
jgi:predicted DNA-binding transcriptional regulator YafY